jgi:hypothetical protein
MRISLILRELVEGRVKIQEAIHRTVHGRVFECVHAPAASLFMCTHECVMRTGARRSPTSLLAVDRQMLLDALLCNSDVLQSDGGVGVTWRSVCSVAACTRHGSARFCTTTTAPTQRYPPVAFPRSAACTAPTANQRKQSTRGCATTRRHIAALRSLYLSSFLRSS